MLRSHQENDIIISICMFKKCLNVLPFSCAILRGRKSHKEPSRRNESCSEQKPSEESYMGILNLCFEKLNSPTMVSKYDMIFSFKKNTQ